MILGVTGHRPNKLGGYKRVDQDKVYRFAVKQLKKFRPSKIITGMAIGWDTQIARAAKELNIPYVAAIPFAGQEQAWPAPNQELYRDLLSYSREIKIVSVGGFTAKKMQVRNIWIVDNCHELLALWNGTPGGTANCVSYAMPHTKTHNVWSEWEKFNG